MSLRRVRLLGCRGIPARHGGFETFAEHLACYLAERGWETTVYCQADGERGIEEGWWKGVRLLRVGVAAPGPWGTVLFDARSVRHAAREDGVVLTLGYNTAVLSLQYVLRGVPHVMNMDGMEWRRAKWSRGQQAWLYLNERLGCWLADRLVADHPTIGEHLATRVSAQKIAVIPYGADALYEGGPPPPLDTLPVEPGRYALIVARPEPENSILEMVRAFSRRERGFRLVVLGGYVRESSAYQCSVMDAASAEVIFPGAIYDKARLASLRYHAAVYLHGHTVGGTNPSLVEALGAGSPVLAHDNAFNRWVAGPGAAYFRTEADCDAVLTRLLGAPAERETMAEASRARHREAFTWAMVLQRYEELLMSVADGCQGGKLP